MSVFGLFPAEGKNFDAAEHGGFFSLTTTLHLGRSSVIDHAGAIRISDQRISPSVNSTRKTSPDAVASLT